MATHDTGPPDEFVQVATLDELEAEGRTLVTENGQAIALFHHDGEVHAVDNRCPHMGFPLAEGTVEDGILTCHWHHARFELSCGDTFDPWADDVPSYPVEVRDGEVWLRPTPEREKPPAEHWADRLETGMEENLRLVIAKATIGLLDADVPDTEPVARAVEFGTRYRDAGWGPGLTILAAMANVLDDLEPDDRKRALYTGINHVATDCASEPPNFDQPSFSTRELPFDRLKTWFRDCVEVRDADGAERCLRTAVAADLPPEQLNELVFAAATDHVYLDTGHTLDFCNKAFETIEHVGDEHAGDVLASLIDSLTGASRSEEQSSWRQPIDLADLLFEVYGGGPTETAGIEALVEEGEGKTWTAPENFQATLLDDDPHATVDALTDAIAAGAATEGLAREVARAAMTRVAQFGTANEFGDWNTVHHTFTYANAVHQATRRTDAVELYRGVFDAAMNVYLDRFLNVPPAPIPELGEAAASDAGTAERDAGSDPDAGTDPDPLLDDLFECFDEEGQVNEAGRIVAAYYDAGHDSSALKRALGSALLREDAGFHTLQNVEAAFRQFDLAEDAETRRLALIATARYLAAHFPTRREAEQTYRIASRLNRGEAIHEERS